MSARSLAQPRDTHQPQGKSVDRASGERRYVGTARRSVGKISTPPLKHVRNGRANCPRGQPRKRERESGCESKNLHNLSSTDLTSGGSVVKSQKGGQFQRAQRIGKQHAQATTAANLLSEALQSVSGTIWCRLLSSSPRSLCGRDKGTSPFGFRYNAWQCELDKY